MEDVQMARALGWASLGIAAAEIAAPGEVQNMLGIDEHQGLLCALGVREAVAGATILSQREVTPTLAAGLWSRVAGDAMDLALLAVAATRTRNPTGLSAATLSVVAITALDVLCAIRVQGRLAKSRSPASRPVQRVPQRSSAESTTQSADTR